MSEKKIYSYKTQFSPSYLWILLQQSCEVYPIYIEGILLWLVKPIVLKTSKRRLEDRRTIKAKELYMMMKNKIKTQDLITLRQALTFG